MLSLAPAALAQSPTTTTLAITSGGSPATTVVSGTVVTLTATVTSGGVSVRPAQVNFCDAAPPHCTDIHLLGTAQMTRAGTAAIGILPPPGTRTYYAVFLGSCPDTPCQQPSQRYAPSSSDATLTVTVSYPTATQFTWSGSPGNYTMTATVTGSQDIPPTGTVSFLDTSNANYVLATAPLVPGTGTSGLGYSFAYSGVSRVDGYPRFIATADFNGDGKPDIAAALSDVGTPPDPTSIVEVYLGNGDGTFLSEPDIAMPGNPSTSVAVGDFNLDGKPDMAVTLSSQPGSIPTDVQILLGNGDGTFTIGQLFSTPAPAFVVTGDWDGDGLPDLAVANTSGANGAVFNSVTVLMDDLSGNGTFDFLSNLPMGYVPSTLVVGDFNGDGLADLAVGNNSGGPFNILLSNGDGTFTVAPLTAATGAGPTSLVAADFNGDGILDLAVANQGSNTVTILLGNGDGTFRTAPLSPATGSLPSAIAMGDVNGDGKVDLVIANSGDGTLSELLGNGDGTFQPATSISVGSAPIALADFNGAGTPAIATTVGVPGISILLPEQGSYTATATATGVEIVGTDAHQIEASYSGDANYRASVSPLTPITAARVATALTLSASLPTSIYGQQVLFTATLSPTIAQDHSATGTVTFYGNGVLLGTASVANGAAALNLTTLPLGTNTLAAAYSGDTNFLPSSTSSFTYVVSIGPTVTTLAAAQNPSPAGQPVILTATVTGGASTPTGAVAFYNSGGLGQVSSGTLDSAGQTTYTTAPLAAGTYTFTASYFGNAQYSASTSQPYSVTVINPDFSIALNPASLTVAQGATGAATVTIAPIVDFNQPVQLSCSGLPTDAACSFSPATVTPGPNASVTSTLTITTRLQYPSVALQRNDSRPPIAAGGFLALLALLRLRRSKLRGLNRGRHALRVSLVLLALGSLATPLALTGCGQDTLLIASPTGTYPIVVTAASASLSHTVNLVLTITN